MRRAIVILLCSIPFALFNCFGSCCENAISPKREAEMRKALNQTYQGALFVEGGRNGKRTTFVLKLEPYVASRYGLLLDFNLFKPAFADEPCYDPPIFLKGEFDKNSQLAPGMKVEGAFRYFGEDDTGLEVYNEDSYNKGTSPPTLELHIILKNYTFTSGRYILRNKGSDKEEKGIVVEFAPQ